MKKLFQIIMNILNIRSLYALKKDGYLVDIGWFKSFKEKKSVDKNGNPIPWIAYPAIDFIETKLNKDMAVFEFGSGASTFWWAQHVKEVDAIEHDFKWYNYVKENKPVNSKIFLEKNESYFSKISSMDKEYDIVFIDGKDRNKCIESSIKALKPDGVIVWDDSQRKEYTPSYKILYNNGFKRIFFTGLSPVCNNKAETSIFYRKNNCLEI